MIGFRKANSTDGLVIRICHRHFKCYFREGIEISSARRRGSQLEK